MEKVAQGDPLPFTCSQRSPRGADGWEGGNLQGKTPEGAARRRTVQARSDSFFI